MAILIAAILTLSIASTTLFENTSAHSPPLNILTSSFIHVAPDPIGLGQTVTVNFWVNQPPPTANGPYGDRFGNMTVKVTQPNGKTETLGPFTSDDTGGTYTTYAPNQLGTYTFQMIFAGQVLAGNNLAAGQTNAFIGDYYQPSTSSPVTLTVQQDPVGGVSAAPLPTNYWENPINAMNVHNWYLLGGASQLITGYSTSSGALYNVSSNYNPYTTAPKTSHIVWTKPVAFGGVLGGQFGGTTTYGNYYSTTQYEHKYEALVINGFLYYTQFPGSSSNPAANVCIDLHTGETVWTDDSTNFGGGTSVQTALTTTGTVTPFYYGQILDYVSPNQYGGLAYVWTQGNLAGINSTGTNYNMFDALTGKYVLSIVNGTSMSMTWDDHGNMVGYYVNSSTANAYNAPTLNKWNSTQCIIAGTNGPAAWQWRPTQNAQIAFSRGIMWSKPIATNYSGNALPSTLAIRNNDGNTLVMNAYAPGSGSFQGGWGIFAGYSAVTGEQLWIQNITTVPYAGDVNTGGSTCGNGVFTISLKSTFSMSGYSMTTGKLLWTTPLTGYNGSTPDAYDTSGGYCSIMAGDSLYYAGFGGDIWSIDVQTGKVNWYTNTTTLHGPAGTNNPYGVWPIWTFSVGGVADGVLFLSEGHEYSPPLFLGAQQLAINTTTGELLWSIDAFNVDSHPVTAYGIMTTLNAYDNQIYAYGMGPSKTTVLAPSIGITTATPITISGTITDISAGSQQQASLANFPNGLPCASDASMSAWMEYVYEQQPLPSDATGVPVTVGVVDANGNYRVIGTTTSDIYGSYSLNWTPDIPGQYRVIATFAGTQSYYPSSASTAFYASEKAPTPSPQTQAALPPTEMYAIGLGIAIIIAIAIVGVILLTAIRKRP